MQITATAGVRQKGIHHAREIWFECSRRPKQLGIIFHRKGILPDLTGLNGQTIGKGEYQYI